MSFVSERLWLHGVKVAGRVVNCGYENSWRSRAEFPEGRELCRDVIPWSPLPGAAICSKAIDLYGLDMSHHSIRTPGPDQRETGVGHRRTPLVQ